MSKEMIRTGWGAPERVTVEKETAVSVWIRPWTFDGPSKGAPRRVAKRGQYENYFDTWKEAHAFLVDRAGLKVVEANSRLKQAQANLEKAKAMKEPA